MYFQSDRGGGNRPRCDEGTSEENPVSVEKATHWISLSRRDFPEGSPEIRGTNDYGGTNQVSPGGVLGKPRAITSSASSSKWDDDSS